MHCISCCKSLKILKNYGLGRSKSINTVEDFTGRRRNYRYNDCTTVRFGTAEKAFRGEGYSIGSEGLLYVPGIIL
jgi:hypothetical protein